MGDLFGPLSADMRTQQLLTSAVAASTTLRLLPTIRIYYGSLGLKHK